MMNPFDKLDLTTYQKRTLDILEISESILLRYGYSKSTIDEIAAAAKLGKGTIYLHWKSKDELFHALFYKISVEILSQIITEVKNNKDLVSFDRLISLIYKTCCDRELIVALFTKDNKLLGRFLDSKNTSQSQKAKFQSLLNSLQMYRENNLIKEDMTVEIQAHTVNMLLIAIFSYDNYTIQKISINEKIEILEKLIKNTFVPETNIEIEDHFFEYIVKALQELQNFYIDQIFSKTIK